MEIQDSKSQIPEADAGAPPQGPFYSPKQIRVMLGDISKTSYYKHLTAADDRGRRLLEYSKLWPGGPRVHTQEQLDAYRNYLNGAGAIANVANREQLLSESESNVSSMADHGRKRKTG